MPDCPSRTSFAAFFSLLLLAACGPVADRPSQSQLDQSEDRRLYHFVEAIFDREVSNSPDLQSLLGVDHGAQSGWTNRSDAHAVEQLTQTREDLNRLLRSFDRSELSNEGQLNFDLFRRELEERLADAPFRRHWYVVDQFRGQYTGALTILQNNHQVKNVSDAGAYISRLEALEPMMADMVDRMRDRAEFGVMAPAFAYPAMINDVTQLLNGMPITDGPGEHPLFADFRAKLVRLSLEPNQAQELLDRAEAALRGPFARGYSALLAELKRQQPLQTANHGVWSLPNGDAFYRRRVQDETTLNIEPEVIHQIGLHEVDRIHDEMRKIMAQVGFDGTLQEFFGFVRTDPNNFYEDSDAGREQFLADARAETAEIFAVANQYFHRLPKAGLEVRRVEPWRENSTSIAFYNRPSLDGSRPGIYYANLADMSGVQKYVFKAITYHEGVPGHHFQIAMAQEIEGLPRFRKFGSQTAYTEGWALYAEQLAREMGFYVNPMHNFGRLQNELWRAVRLVVDTGIHHQRWTRQQAIDYFRENTPLSEQDIVTEVERYFVNPGQALAYKMGMIKILELRQSARERLGERFNIRDFHRAVMESGALPLPFLEKQVERYVENTPPK